LVTVASDEPLAVGVSVLDHNDVNAIADFVESTFLRNTPGN